MSVPSHPQSPGDPAGAAQPSTAKIPVVQPASAPVTKQLPPHPGATSFGATSFGPPASGAQPVPAVQPPVQPPAQPTGPVDWMPGLPGLGTPSPPPTPAAPPTPVPTWPESLEGDDAPRERAKPRAARLPQDRSTLVGVGLAALAMLLLQLGLVLDLGSQSLWDVVPLWSAFATAAVLVGLLALLYASSPGGRSRAGQAWRVGAAGLVGLAVFWLLVALPRADGDRGFLLTAALGSLGAALWVGAKRD